MKVTNKHHSEGELILKLHVVAQSLGRTPTINDIRELSKTGRVASLDVYRAVFGRFSTALTRARLMQPRDPEVEKEKLLGEIRTLRNALKRPLVKADVVEARKKGRMPSIYSIRRMFGSISRAIEAADAGRIYTRDKMIKFLRELDATLDRPIHPTDIKRLFRAGKGPSIKVIYREFGGIVKARRVAGTKKVYTTKRIGWSRGLSKYTREELISQLKRLAKKLGRKPTNREINAASRDEIAMSLTFAKAFGSLPAAYRAAGFEIVRTSRRYTDDEIRLAIEKLSKKIGRFPTYNEFVAASKAGECPDPGTIVKRIGKLADLRQRFGSQI